MKKLTTLDFLVYEEVKKRSINGEWTSVGHLAELFNCGKRTIRKSIQRIRENDMIQKIILTDYGKGYKLMSDNDEFDMLTKTKIKILKQLKRYWKDVDRYNKNHQNKITFTKHERDVFESLIRGDENENCE